MMLPDLKQRLQHLERNVGGGDLVTRVLAIAGLAISSALILPVLKVPFPLVKISLLATTEFGLIALMVGMFLKSKTYFAGFQLCVACLTMLWLAARGLPYVGAVVGVAFIAAGIFEVITRKSRLNALFGISSFNPVVDEANLLEEALLPDNDEAAPSPALNPQGTP
jgi:hypothetical protein